MAKTEKSSRTAHKEAVNFSWGSHLQVATGFREHLVRVNKAKQLRFFVVGQASRLSSGQLLVGRLTTNN